MIRLFSFAVILTLALCGAQVANADNKDQQSPSPVITGTFESIIGPVHDDHYRVIFTELEKKNDTLYQALKSAYEQNPSLRAAREELLSVNEQLPQAQAGFKPTVVAKGDVTHTDTDTVGTNFITSDGGNTSKTIGLELEQPIFTSGTTTANIKQARNIITAQQLALSETEQSLIYDAAVAYMNVYRDSAILKLNQNNLELVSQQLEQAQNRFKVGELTRTDVSQSEARLAAAKADVINAESNFNSSIAVYKQIVTEPPPINMAYPAKALPLPDTIEEALSLSQSNNRAVLQAKFVNAAAKNQVDSLVGDLLPKVSAIGGLNKSYDPSAFIEEQRQASIGLAATFPLYQGGAAHSRVREARKKANQRQIQITEAENRAQQEAISQWEALKAARAELKARQSQIDAARVAWQGVQYEVEYGERTTLDALDANRELLDAQVSFITTRRNEVVAQFALARSLGLLVPQNLGFSTVNP